MIYTLQAIYLVIMLSSMLVRNSAFRSLSVLKVPARLGSSTRIVLPKVNFNHICRHKVKTGLLGSTSYFSSSRHHPDLSEEELMDERIKEAEGWVSMKLSDKEAKEFNKRLGIENEVLQAIEEEKQIVKAGKNDKLGKKKSSRDYLSKLDMGPDYAELGKLKGFLEMNPFMCPGCGAPFQSKAESNPGMYSCCCHN